jgi:hypothetical protein
MEGGTEKKPICGEIERIELPPGLTWPTAEGAVEAVHKWERECDDPIFLVIEIYKLLRGMKSI